MIVTVTLNPALQVSYAAQEIRLGRANPVSQVSYRAAGAGLAVARVLHTFGHEVVAAGLAGGAAGELIRAELSRSGIATQFTQIALESRRDLRVSDSSAATVTSFSEPAPYITTEELGRLAADFRALMDGATAVVLCGSLPAGLPPEIYGSLASYAAEAGVPAVLDAGGSAMWHAVARRPALAIPRGTAAEPAALVARGARAAVAASDADIRVVTASGRWRAWLPDREPDSQHWRDGARRDAGPRARRDAGPRARPRCAARRGDAGRAGAAARCAGRRVRSGHRARLVVAGCAPACRRADRGGAADRRGGPELLRGPAARCPGRAPGQLARVWRGPGLGILSRQTGTCSTAVEGSRASSRRRAAARGGAARRRSHRRRRRTREVVMARLVSGAARSRIRAGSPPSTPMAASTPPGNCRPASTS